MIRFIDLTEAYYHPGYSSPLCAFLSTSSDRFLENEGDGTHTFNGLDEIQEHPQAERLLALVPDGFFDKEDSE